MGLGPGNWRLGLTLTAVFLPLTAVGLLLGINDPGLKKYYPFSKEAMSSPGKFVIYESAYLVLYYLPWEFTFRGVIVFSLLALLPHTVPGLVVVVMVSTFLSTIYHIGHPSSEVLGAFILGLHVRHDHRDHRLIPVCPLPPRAGGHPERLHCVPRPYAHAAAGKRNRVMTKRSEQP